MCTKILFLERVKQPKISPKNPGNAFSDALLISCFQNFAADAAEKKTRSTQFFETALRTVFIHKLIHSLIRINSGPNILKSYFLHCLRFHAEVLRPSLGFRAIWRSEPTLLQDRESGAATPLKSGRLIASASRRCPSGTSCHTPGCRRPF